MMRLSETEAAAADRLREDREAHADLISQPADVDKRADAGRRGAKGNAVPSFR